MQELYQKIYNGCEDGIEISVQYGITRLAEIAVKFVVDG